LHADREAVRINCLLHPPLNPLPSREGKERKTTINGGKFTYLKWGGTIFLNRMNDQGTGGLPCYYRPKFP